MFDGNYVPRKGDIVQLSRTVKVGEPVDGNYENGFRADDVRSGTRVTLRNEGTAQVVLVERAKKPKPPEPTHIGAIVKCEDGTRWIRLNAHRFDCNDWFEIRGEETKVLTGGTRRVYSSLDVVEVEKPPVS